jgi:hypothetical protein
MQPRTVPIERKFTSTLLVETEPRTRIISVLLIGRENRAEDYAGSVFD